MRRPSAEDERIASRISHPCLDCGADLRRVRARRTEGLVIVTCPACGRTAARRTDDRAARRRAAVRRTKCLVALALQIAGVMLFVGLINNVCDPYALGLLAGRIPAAGQFLVTGVIALALGAWLALAFPHWSLLSTWLGFALVVIGTFVTAWVLVPLVGLAARESGLPVGGQPVRLDRAVAATAVLTAIMLVATAGAPVGTALRTAAARGQSRLWRARRRRLREGSLR